MIFFFLFDITSNLTIPPFVNKKILSKSIIDSSLKENTQLLQRIELLENSSCKLSEIMSSLLFPLGQIIFK